MSQSGHAPAFALDRVRLALGERLVIDALTAEIPAGRLSALAGPNGAGKSTLLRALAGLLTPSAGRLTLTDGRALADLTPADRAKNIAYLAQDRTAHWPLSVRRTIALGRLPHRPGGGAEGASDRAAIDRAMAEMDVAGLADRAVTELSGGERARVLVARALAQATPILLADEPAAGLDPAHQLELFAHLARLAHAGRTVVVALHDLSLAARYCDHVLLLRAGSLLASGPPEAVLTPAHIAAAYGIDAHVGRVGCVPFVLPLGPLLGPLPHSGPEHGAERTPARDPTAGGSTHT